MSKENSMRILKTSECPSLSGQSTLTYKIGLEKKEVFLSISGNTGSGKFNKGWVPLSKIESSLDTEEPITSRNLRALFEGKSSNSPGFLLAVLLEEGLVKVSKDNPGQYERVDPADFKKGIKTLKKEPSPGRQK